MADNKINDVQPKEAETKTERYLLGLIAKRAERLGFGKVILELTFQDGVLKHSLFRERNDGFKF